MVMLSLGFVIRNGVGDVFLAGATLGAQASTIQAEAQAVREGVKSIISLDISHLIIEGDNLGVMISMKGS